MKTTPKIDRQAQFDAKDCRPVSIDVFERGGEYDITATIETAHFLAERCEVDEEITARFEAWQKEQDGSWFEIADLFCSEELGMHRHARDNVYNGENDLSQVYVWEVWTENKEESDWIYAEGALVVVFVHTGCDVRGGYSGPLFLHHHGDYAAPLDFVASFNISEARRDGEELDSGDFQRLDEHWQCGYSSCPSARFSEDIARVFWTGPDWLIVRLKSGEIAKVYANQPYV